MYWQGIVVVGAAGDPASKVAMQPLQPPPETLALVPEENAPVEETMFSKYETEINPPDNTPSSKANPLRGVVWEAL